MAAVAAPIVLRKGDRGIDMINPNVNPANAKAEGDKFVSRYIKNLTQKEIDGWANAGIAVLPIFESYANRCLEGRAAGLADGAASSKTMHDTFKMPYNMPLIVACDINVTDANVNQVAEYVYGFADGSKHMTVVYGNWKLFDKVGWRVAWNWQAGADSWSFDWVKRIFRGVHPTAAMWQRPSLISKLTGNVDPNIVTRDCWGWNGRPEGPAPIVPPKPPVVVPVPPFNPEKGQYGLYPVDKHKDTIQLTSSGDLVKYAQAKLKIFIDGDFGPQTDSAVRALQTSKKIPVDGVVGPVTWPYIDALK